MTVKQTAGREQLGDFAPQFAHFNDDVLFGEVWADEESLSARDRSLLTVTALITKGLLHNYRIICRQPRKMAFLSKRLVL